MHYPYPRNWFYLIQRITGVILFFFIAFHVLNFRFGMIPGLNTVSVAHRPDQAFDIVSREFRMVPIFIIYMVGITATVWHFANGIWLFMVDWGITIGERAQRLTGYACIAFWRCAAAGRNQRGGAFIRPGGLLGGHSLSRWQVNGIKIAIVGGGLAGLAAAMKIAEAGHAVDLFSVVPVKRSHSVCAQGGINGAVNTKGEGDSTWEHFDDTVYGGDFLANQPPVKAMCDMAPAIIYLFDRMGVPFSRTKEGCSIFVASAARCITARRSPELRPASSFSTRSTNRCAATKSRAKSRSTKTGRCCRSCSTIIRSAAD